MHKDLPPAQYKPDIKPVNQNINSPRNSLNCLRHWDYLVDIENDTKKLDKSETLILGFDSSKDGKEVALSVSKYNGSTLTSLNIFHGEEALDLYKKLIEPKDLAWIKRNQSLVTSTPPQFVNSAVRSIIDGYVNKNLMTKRRLENK